MKIESVRVRPFAIPLTAPLQTARGPISERRGFVVELMAGGVTGLGEASPHPAVGEEVFGECEAELAAVASRLPGADTREVENEFLSCVPAPVAMGLDLALRDLEARETGRPLAVALGGAAGDARPLAVGGLLEGRDADAAVEAARALHARGFRTAKLKAARDPGATVGQVAAVRRAVPGLRLRVDVNGAWSREEAVDAARALSAFDLEWLEQPVAPGDLDAMAAVRAAGVRVAADEAIQAPGDVGLHHAERAIDVVVVKFVQVGGLRGAIETAQAAEQCGLALSLTTGIDTGIATAALLHLATALRPGPALGCATLSLLGGDLVSGAPVEGPRMAAPPGAGIGVQLEEGSPFLGEGIGT